MLIDLQLSFDNFDFFMRCHIYMVQFARKLEVIIFRTGCGAVNHDTYIHDLVYLKQEYLLLSI